MWALVRLEVYYFKYDKMITMEKEKSTLKLD